MKHWMITLPALALVVGVAGPANAAGCVKGAVVGGVAGHMAGHHGVLGAAAGCAVGHHEANKAAEQHRADRQPMNNDRNNPDH
jgi:hypothetical protein